MLKLLFFFFFRFKKKPALKYSKKKTSMKIIMTNRYFFGNLNPPQTFKKKFENTVKFKR